MLAAAERMLADGTLALEKNCRVRGLVLEKSKEALGRTGHINTRRRKKTRNQKSIPRLFYLHKNR